MGGYPPVLHVTDDAMLTPHTHFYIRKRAALFFPSGAHKMAAVRKSLRLMKQDPDILETAFKCHFCLKDDDGCQVGSILLPCCKHFVHFECQKQWETVLEGDKNLCHVQATCLDHPTTTRREGIDQW